MKQFTDNGYRFYLDDFGAGYSNFNCLLQLPFQVIKLDANLIRMDLGEKGRGCLGLTKTLTGFLHELKLHVVAEGVETMEDAETLKQHGVDKIQGYVYAKPMPEKELLVFYAANGSAQASAK